MSHRRPTALVWWATSDCWIRVQKRAQLLECVDLLLSRDRSLEFPERGTERLTEPTHRHEARCRAELQADVHTLGVPRRALGGSRSHVPVDEFQSVVFLERLEHARVMRQSRARDGCVSLRGARSRATRSKQRRHRSEFLQRGKRRGLLREIGHGERGVSDDAVRRVRRGDARDERPRRARRERAPRSPPRPARHGTGARSFPGSG